MARIAIIDYGLGNLHSVKNALDYIGEDSEITSDVGVISRADAVILPGVGAFPDGMAGLNKAGLVEELKKSAGKKPFLGICLGMQMLFDMGVEHRDTAGIGSIPGCVSRIKTPCKLPQIGWNSLKMMRDSPIIKGLPEQAHVYFVHSYCAVPEFSEHLVAVTDYGVDIAAIVQRGNVYGCQFHPEKSGETGLMILKNFARLAG